MSLVLAVTSVLLAIVVSGPFANAIVSAGEIGVRRDCGTVWEPDAETDVCAAALTSRAWLASGLLGVTLVGAAAAVVTVGSPRQVWRRRLAVAVVTVSALVIVSMVIWSGVIDRTMGS